MNLLTKRTGQPKFHCSYLDILEPMVLFSSEPGGGGGSTPPATKLLPGDLEREDEEGSSTRAKNPTVTAAKYNNDINAMAMHIDTLESEAFKGRGARNRLRDEVTGLQGQLPKDGAVVLNAEQATAWQQYQELGKPEELKGLKEENITLKDTNAKAQRDGQLRDVADSPAPGLKYELDILRELDAKIPGITYEQRDVEKDGVKQKVWFAKYKDGQGDAAPLVEKEVHTLFTEKYPKFMPALVVAGDEGGQSFDDDLSPENDGGTPWPEQPSGGNGSQQMPKGGAGNTLLKSRYGHNAPGQKQGQ